MDFRNNIVKFLDENDYSASSVAKAIGVSQAALSLFLKGSYEGNNEKIQQLLEHFIERETEKRKNPKKELKFCMTNNAKRIFEVLRMSHLDGEIAVIIGNAGLGKTTALREYCRRNKDVIHIESNLSYSTKSVLQELSKKTGGDGLGSINMLIKEIVEKLKESGRMIIVDEGEHLPTRALDLLRTINDQSGIGIAITGLPRLLNNLKGRKGEHAYLYSRVGLVLKIDELEDEDVKELVYSYFPSANGISKDFIKYCNGNARRLSKLLLRVQRLSEVNEGKLTSKMVEVANSLIIN
jgi:hypothetical protein